MKEYISLYLGLVCGYMYHLFLNIISAFQLRREEVYIYRIGKGQLFREQPTGWERKKKHIAHKIMTVCLFNAWDVSSAGIERDIAQLQQEV